MSGTPTSTPSSSSSMGKINIQPSQASVLVQALKKQMELARAASNDPEKAKAHYAKAEKINQILVNYQNQQKAKQDQQGSSAATGVDTASGTGSALSSAQPSGTNSPKVSQSPLPSGDTPPGGSGSSGNGSGSKSVITVQKLNSVRASLDQLSQSIKKLEDSKKGETDASKIDAADKEIAKLKPKLAQFQKIAQYFKNDLANQSKSRSSSPTPPPQEQNTAPSKPVSESSSLSTATPQPHQPSQNSQLTKAPSSISSLNPTYTQVPGSSSNPGNGIKPPVAALNKPKPAPAIPANLPNITRTTTSTAPLQAGIRAPSLATKSLIGNRPALPGGIVGNGLGYSLSSPSITRMPYEYSSHITPTSIPDNGGRVLTKRRLAELANTIGATEGDSKTTIDNDVEDLILDLADEFVTSVTSFACKIAKHRKVDKVDLRDFQLHLERTWNIRIPGNTLDEIKPPRKYQPTAEYLEKKTELDPKPNGK